MRPPPRRPRRPPLLNHSPLRGSDKFNQHLHIFSAIRLRPQLLYRLRSIQLRSQQHPVRMMDLLNPFFRKSPPLQPDRIQSISMRPAFGGSLGKRQHVASNRSPPANKRMRPNPHKVMHRAKRPDRSPVSHRDVPAERSRVRHNNVASNLAIMRNMRISHDQVMRADPRASSALHRAPVDSDELANHIMIANLQPRSLARISNILRSKSNGSKRREPIVGANSRWPVDRHVR